MMVQGGTGQPNNIGNLEQFFNRPHSEVALPKFNGIDLPSPPQVDFNPFGDENDDSDGFDDFADFQTSSQP